MRDHVILSSARAALNRTGPVFCLILGTYLMATFIYWVAEDKSYGDSLWWGVVTWSTTGYGDQFPVTGLGRIAAAAYMITTVFLMMFAAAHVVAAVVEDRNLFSHEEQERMEGALWLIGRRMDLFDADSTELPSLEWFKEKGFAPDEL
ncbi:potassium channel family protein [Williamsia sp. CHRR-6]|uniref:potassium channel family protein n=1 Tax=Williamsia sp. CHRR-6 TaxID=2835871 RepID=UPI001BDAC5FD|nr:potassium channel family protein [Williamsia sp. CHRR-6]MBT0567698.1 two pore domain potassium channel family protein [Williamsia sp. CHRR-6]